MKATGTRLDRVIAVGGGSQSSQWLRILATALDTPIAVPTDGDFGATYGAARLGMMASTDQPNMPLAAPQIATVVEPDPALRSAFDDAYVRYRALYSAIKDLS
jgi:xylulokinase